MIRVLRRGALAGAAGGCAAALFLLAVGERSISEAIALEEASGHGGDAVLSRSVQLVGGAVGALLVGAASGAILAIVLAAVRHRLRGSDDVERATRLAAVAYVTLYLVPFLKYPANPPAVGDPATVGRRTALYLLVLAWSVLATWSAWRARDWLASRGVAPCLSGPAAVGVWAVLVGLAFAGLPGSPDPLTAPATLIWRFRVASAGGQALFWAVAGVALGWLWETADSRDKAAAGSPTRAGGAP